MTTPHPEREHTPLPLKRKCFDGKCWNDDLITRLTKERDEAVKALREIAKSGGSDGKLARTTLEKLDQHPSTNTRRKG